MITKFDGKCSVCGTKIQKGTDVDWNHATRTIKHKGCASDGEAVGPVFEPIRLMDGSHEQEAIWEYAEEGRGHIVVNAGPGTGKTWTGVQYCLRAVDQDIVFACFNRHNKVEIAGKATASKLRNVRVATYHGLGYAMLHDEFKGLANSPDDNKTTAILEALVPMPDSQARGDWRRMLNITKKLVSFAKNYLMDFTADDFRAKMIEVADRHGVIAPSPVIFENALSLIRPALEESIKRAHVIYDNDDMIWLPIQLNLKPRNTPSRFISDESQDLNACQHALIAKFLPHGRAIVIGDVHQAIYQFRGAMANSMATLTATLAATKRGVKTFPLTITRRCPKLHVALATNVYPDLVAVEDAPNGVIIETSEPAAIKMMKAGDLVISRTNQPLIKCAYALIKRGIRPDVKGRDIGAGLTSLIKVLDEAINNYRGQGELGRLEFALNEWVKLEVSKLAELGDAAEGRIASIRDKADCLREFIANNDTINAMVAKIETMFSKEDAGVDKNAVTLGTVHRTKGLESETVFVLAPELIPHPAAKVDWEIEGEHNIAWIAATRAKYTKDAPGTLVFCGKIPTIYTGGTIPPYDGDDETGFEQNPFEPEHEFEPEYETE